MNSRRPSEYLRRYLASGPTSRHGQRPMIPRDTEGDSGCRAPVGQMAFGVSRPERGTRNDEYDDSCYGTTAKETHSTKEYEKEPPSSKNMTNNVETRHSSFPEPYLKIWRSEATKNIALIGRRRKGDDIEELLFFVLKGLNSLCSNGYRFYHSEW